MKKVVLATLPSLYSLYFLNVYLRLLEGKLSAVVVSTKPVAIGRRSVTGPQDLGFLWKRFGGRYMGYLLLNQLLMSVIELRSKGGGKNATGLWGLHRLAQEFGFEVYSSNNFNADECIEEINRLAADLLVINGCNQIVSADFLHRISADCVNIHPSFLPDDRGVDPVFQKLARGADEVSVSLHQVTAGVDEGPVYVQKKSSLPVNSTGHPVSYLQSLLSHSLMGAQLLQEFLINQPQAQAQIGEPQFAYRSWPARQEIAQFRAQGGRLLSRGDLRALLAFDSRHFMENSFQCLLAP